MYSRKRILLPRNEIVKFVYYVFDMFQSREYLANIYSLF